MRKWLAGWLSWAADCLYPNYSERVRRGYEPLTEEQALNAMASGAREFVRAQETLLKADTAGTHLTEDQVWQYMSRGNGSNARAVAEFYKRPQAD